MLPKNQNCEVQLKHTSCNKHSARVLIYFMLHYGLEKFEKLTYEYFREEFINDYNG